MTLQHLSDVPMFFEVIICRSSEIQAADSILVCTDQVKFQGLTPPCSKVVTSWHKGTSLGCRNVRTQKLLILQITNKKTWGNACVS